MTTIHKAQSHIGTRHNIFTWKTQMGKTTECFFNIINENNTFNVYVHQHKKITNSLILQH